MRVLVVGVGAVGGFYGALLAKAGLDLFFIARGETLEVLKKGGITIETPSGRFTVPVQASSNVRDAGERDLILICVKSYDTESVARMIEPALHSGSVVVSLQNGIGNVETIGSIIGEERVFCGVLFLSSDRIAPATVRYLGVSSIRLGRFRGGSDPRLEKVRELFEEAGIDCVIHPEIEAELWKKLIWNASFNGVTTLTRKTVGECLATESGRELIRTAMDEVVSVLEKKGIPVDPTLIETWMEGEGIEEFRTSMLQDRLRGNRLEHEAIYRPLLKEAARFGIRVPVLESFYRLLDFLSGTDL